MADAKASMRPRTSLICHNACGALYHLSVRLITELKHFVILLTTTQRGNPLSSENSDQRHVAESISNDHPVFRHTPGFLFCQCCKQKKKRLHAGQFLEINQLLVRDLLHQNVKIISLTNRGRLHVFRKWEMPHLKKKLDWIPAKHTECFIFCKPHKTQCWTTMTEIYLQIWSDSWVAGKVPLEEERSTLERRVSKWDTVRGSRRLRTECATENISTHDHLSAAKLLHTVK